MSQLSLPVTVFGLAEVHRLERELETLEQYLAQARLRPNGTQTPALPRLSRLLEALASDNGLNLLQPEARQQLAGFLRLIVTRAPVVHMSFAADPSAAFTAKVVTWLRGNIHPLVLVQVGLQPSIAAGCVVRTANKTFDLSLRARLRSQQAALAQSLERLAA